MADGKEGSIHATSDGGVSGKHPEPEPLEFLVGPTTSDQYNTILLFPNPIACWRVDDVRFAFNSSFVNADPTPDNPNDIRAELAHLVDLVKDHQGAPLSVFGHADPVGTDDYNKKLSGRRAAVIYGLLVAHGDTALGVQLWQQVAAAEHWGKDQRQVMEQVTGLPSTTPINTLIQSYIQKLCPVGLKLGQKDFLAQGADSNGKGDYQGCSEFNPVLLFSEEDQSKYDQARQRNSKDDQPTIQAQNAANAPNRRVLVLLFRKGSKVDPAKWPCPSSSADGSGCKKRFWGGGPDGEKRRSTHLSGVPRKFEDKEDTFGCRFFQRISYKSPCAMLLTACQYSITGPANVPGLSKYKYRIDIPSGRTPTNIVWTSDKPTATFEGATDKLEAIVVFQNSKPDWIKLKATFTLDDQRECAEKRVALVKVEVGAPTFHNLGTPSGISAAPFVFLVNPPAPPAVPTWVITNDPGSDVSKFTYNGTSQPGEPRKRVLSNGGGGGPAYDASATVTLTSPAEKPDALQKIQVGFIQHGSDSGSATYSAGLTRHVATPTSATVDWLSSTSGAGGTDEWPWYDATARATGTGTGTWSQTLKMNDSPTLAIPAQYKANDPSDAHSSDALTSASETFAFVIRIAARTLDSELDADKHYFDESNSTWSVNNVWPVVPAVSIVTHGTSWVVPPNPSEVDVNVVPTIINHNPPYFRWEY